MRYFLMLLAMCSQCAAATIQVPSEYATIQEGIDAAEDGDTVLVAAGNYVITKPIIFNKPGEPLKNIEVRAESGPDQTVIRMSDTPDDINEASIVIFRNQESVESVLEGFTLTGGSGSLYSFEWGSARVGGAVICEFNCQPQIIDCVILENTAEYGGGAFCWEGGSPRIERCVFLRNLAVGGDWNVGGGICCAADASPTIVDSMFKENAATGPVGFQGGGAYLTWGCSSIILRSSFIRNSAGRGGGIVCASTCFAELTDCTIESNAVSNGQGGGIVCYSEAAPKLNRCRIVGNYGEGGEWGTQGAGIMCGGNADDATLRTLAFVSNCIIAGNRAAVGNGGGGVHCYRSESQFFNCTITANMAPMSGGAVCHQGTPEFTNSIIWGNIPESSCGQVSQCLTGEDPLFVDSGEYDFFNFDEFEIGDYVFRVPDFIVEPPDYRLSPNSPAIDAGNNDIILPTDMDSIPRPQGEGVDIGAYEYTTEEVIIFRRGDCNNDSDVNISDPQYLLNWLFIGGSELPCLAAGNANDDDEVNISDASYLLNFLFLGGPSPVQPFPECGPLLMDETLECAESSCQ